MLRLNPIVHELASALRVIGMRDRLRCKRCKAVGTYKPHGGWIDRCMGDARPVRRWMCKYCGLYYGPEGQLEVHRNLEMKYWDFEHQIKEGFLGERPRDILKREKVNPWAG
jgi:hypothetical protein